MNEPIPLKHYKTLKQAEIEINPPKTELTKQSVYNQIRLLVNTTPNDLELGEKVRQLFS